ncbi:avidin/streptavidin family protein [Novosphingobium mangrovi (ex Huang et al. 2023)]|uniref:Avidin/streptavidin family protein n=1 Tax=Novosphingobium mangrovi (ex Huang et al. 2023) TaxID=2976432 RepID=A0ABT2I1X5_9SPHN|nr:avidin/streptavidin family protein [Novosphingobium mangrovi (ex Huang et al. 2023)]MCT2398810.1 avidin/streptavidin family protein [Novosphingobium mangrovi (ex Huang et al. 2023)]
MTVAGTWENEYGSRMTLAVDGAGVFGIYESTTGSTGRYRVVGHQSQESPTPEAGQPVALAIAWHSVAGGPADASWNWVSALGGQISVVDGAEVLSASHLLVATSDFPGLCRQGVFCDKLTYRRVATAPAFPGHMKCGELQIVDVLAGCWQAGDGTVLDIHVRPEPDDRFGVLGGCLTVGGQALEIVGFSDVNAVRDRIGFQSVAITALDRARNATVALGGWIEQASGVLTLQLLTNHATGPADTYLQTAIRPLQFLRSDGG